MRRHGVDPPTLLAGRDGAAARALVADLVAWARELMRSGAPLARAIPGRAGWELRFVVQGGLRILERIDRLDGATLRTRPTLGMADAPAIAWRALRDGAALPPRDRRSPSASTQARAMTPEQYVQDKAAESGSSFYYAFLFLPPPRRAAITAFYAFCREVDDVVDEVTDPGVAATKLAWWRRRSRAAFAGRPSHPAMRALMPHTADYDIEAATAGGDRGLRDGPGPVALPRLRRACAHYCHLVAGVVGEVAADIFGRSRPDRRPTPTGSAWRCSSPTSFATSATMPAAAASTCRSTS